MANDNQNGECAICGIKDVIDRCHIYPTRIIKKLMPIYGFNKFKKLSYSGNHIIALCKNHHWLYDHFRLNREEFDKIKQFVVAGLQECANVIRVHAEKGLYDDDSVRTINKWVNSMNKIIVELYGK